MDLSAIEHSIQTKMRAAGIALPTITAFLNAVGLVLRSERGLMPEETIEPILSLPHFDVLSAPNLSADAHLLRQLAVIKLNGGLGTSMGLEHPRSLLPVKGTDTFLDFIARQVLHLRECTGGSEPTFYLMDSFSTRDETLEYLRRYPRLDTGEPLDFLQNMVPKLETETLRPIAWPAQPELEWCPPGHGDLYPALLASGLLDHLLARGVRYLFVSNADNLGATADLRLLHHLAESDLSFLMEVAERTPADRKGGHLARRAGDGRLLLREAAQCPPDDEAAFQDIDRHRFFNTNNVWIRLDHLKAELDRHRGALLLPVIANAKTVDPRDARSPRVLQLESAMGAAIECFERADAIVVPRTRFTPVKGTSDLLVLRSDACRVTDDHCLVLDESRLGQPPVVELDPGYYQLVQDFDQLFPAGPPSLLRCTSLGVTGSVRFSAAVVCEGDVHFVNGVSETKTLGSGTYRDITVEL